MTFSIRTKGKTHTLEVVEEDVTCVLTLGTTHEIVTKGDDINELANRISYSYRTQYGQGTHGKEFLKAIRYDLNKENGVIEET